nr:MAG TPA: hypothetical protein [Caudoviricetes sp.]
MIDICFLLNLVNVRVCYRNFWVCGFIITPGGGRLASSHAARVFDLITSIYLTSIYLTSISPSKITPPP